jgi:hypothetical protein
MSIAAITESRGWSAWGLLRFTLIDTLKAELMLLRFSRDNPEP